MKGKGKLSHLIKLESNSDNPKFNVWDEEDSMIMFQCQNSIQPEISDTYLFLFTSKKIWEVVRQMYSKFQDVTQVQEIQTKIKTTKQGIMYVKMYYNTMKRLWLELGHYQNIKRKCSEKVDMLQKYVETKKIFEFLVGLLCGI